MAARRKIFKRKRTRFRERHSFGPLPKNDRKRTTREREGRGWGRQERSRGDVWGLEGFVGRRRGRGRIETRWDGRCHDDQLSFSPPCTPKKGVAPPLHTAPHPTPPLAVWIFLGRLPLESDATTPEFFPPRGENLSLSPPIPLSHPRSTAVPSVECAQRRPFVAGFSPPFCRYGWLARRRHCRRPSRRLVPRVPDFKGSSCSAHHLSTAPTS